ncbi:MAG: glycosyltransferase family 2 protein [Pirellulaceae bacterium]|nr:glycosyltransferase family 2 protein [Pirellulaceae bacterium]HJN11021.1 glycosyltransferase family 2 protein [Pirellulaceae bacterium]
MSESSELQQAPERGQTPEHDRDRIQDQAIRDRLDQLVVGNLDERVESLERILGSDVCRRIGVYKLPVDFVLSVIIPVYNEATTITNMIARVRNIDLTCEIIVVDDGSSDGTREVLQSLADDGGDCLRVFFHDKNQGKGAALITGFQQATGDVVVVQDADMEYDPQDLRFLLQPIVEDYADVVYGSRFSGADRQVSPLWHLAANQVITKLFSFRHGRKFTDVETCYKVFRRELIHELVPRLREKRFGIELEITARLLKNRETRFYERPISYVRRTYAEGKKIGWRDGLWALWCILRY